MTPTSTVSLALDRSLVDSDQAIPLLVLRGKRKRRFDSARGHVNTKEE
jgi:hypothetical protein